MMKNKHVLLIVLLFTFNAVFAQKNTVQLVSSNDNETILTFSSPYIGELILQIFQNITNLE